ncbi:MAG: tetratricopeptide repeat protein [Planctomycetota bacterium]|jgi:Tfp pilus assembly protein PilF
MRSLATIIACLSLAAITGCQPTSNGSDHDAPTALTPIEPNTDLAILLNSRANEAIEGGDHDAALPLLHEALAADVNYAPTHNNLGLIHFTRGDWPEAAERFKRVIQLTPQLPTAHNNLGLVHEQLGDLPASIERYRRAHELEPGNPQFLGNLARATHRHGSDAQTLRPLLEKLITLETREDWRLWAQEQLALMPDTD